MWAEADQLNVQLLMLHQQVEQLLQAVVVRTVQCAYVMVSGAYHNVVNLSQHFDAQQAI